jgi:hypothetical protein
LWNSAIDFIVDKTRRPNITSPNNYAKKHRKCHFRWLSPNGLVFLLVEGEREGVWVSGHVSLKMLISRKSKESDEFALIIRPT